MDNPAKQPKHPSKSTTLVGVLAYIVGMWWPDAKEVIANPDLWEFIGQNIGLVIKSVGALLTAFGVRRQMAPLKPFFGG